METQQNIISSEAKLSAIAGLMFFAPFVKNNLKFNPNFSEEEKDFILWYSEVWFVNIILLVIVLWATLANIAWVHPIFSRITTIGWIAIFIIITLAAFACANSVKMWAYNESVIQPIQNKWQLLKAYTPILNFVLRYRQENYNVPYRWLKESILLRSVFIFGGLLLWTSFWVWALSVIIIRLVLLFMNVDIIPVSVKKALNSIFLCNPEEIFAYIFSPIIAKINRADYETILQARKQSYAQWQTFGLWIIIQYILFIAILYRIYHNAPVWWNLLITGIPAFLRIIRIIVFSKNKWTVLKIPIISEIVWLIIK